MRKLFLFAAMMCLACGVASGAETAPKGGRPVVQFETSMGVIKIELYPDKAPITVKNFLTYVREGYYDGLVFHRVNRFPAGDPTIRFTLVSGTPYIQLIDEGMQGGERCARVKVVEPAPPSGSLPQSCSVHVSAGADGLIGYTVDLKVADMELEFF